MNRIRNEYDANRQIVGTPRVPAWMVPSRRPYVKPAPRGLIGWLLALLGVA